MTDTDWPDLNGATILQVIHDLSAGGAERTTIEMAEAIKRAGGRALVASSGGRMEPTLARAGGELYRMDLATKNPTKIMSNANRIAELIGDCKVDLVHARSRAPAWSAWRACRKTGTPFVTTYHGAYSGTSGPKRLYNSIMARGDRVIANSQWTADHVASVHDVPFDRLVTIPRGVDVSIFDPAKITGERLASIARAWNIDDDDDRIVVLLAGRLTPWKGQLLAVEAFGRLSDDEKDRIHMIFAGDAQGRQSYVERIETTIVENGLAGAVSIVGHCDDMAAAYALADIVMAPSQRPEAFGRVAVEAAAMAKPVIVSDHGGQRETVIEGETGTRAEPGSIASLAACLRALVNMPKSAREGMGQAGQAHAREVYSIEKLKRATLNVYLDVLNAEASVES